MVAANSNRNADQMHIVVAFGLVGIASGLSSEKVFQWLTVASRTRLPHSVGPGTLLLPGLLLLLGLIAALAICERIGWLNVHRSGWRCLVAAPLVTLNGLCGLTAGILAVFCAGLAMKAAFVIRGHPIFTLLMLIFGVVIGIFSSISVLSLALYVFAHDWHREGWVALIVCGFGAAAISLGAVPNFIPMAIWGYGGGGASFDRFFRVLLFLTHTFYSGCAGYWLALSG